MKKIVLVFLVMLLSGCKVEYNLDFQDETLIEDVKVFLPLSLEEDVELLKRMKPSAILGVVGNYKYEINHFEENENFIGNYKYSYDYTNFGRAYYLNECFDAVSFVKTDDGRYMLNTSTGFNCMVFEYMKVDEYQVNITSNREVLESNGLTEGDNVYSWTITEDNASTFKLSITFGDVIINDASIFEKYLLFFVIIGLSIISLIVYVIIKGINKKNNEI